MTVLQPHRKPLIRARLSTDGREDHVWRGLNLNWLLKELPKVYVLPEVGHERITVGRSYMLCFWRPSPVFVLEHEFSCVQSFCRRDLELLGLIDYDNGSSEMLRQQNFDPNNTVQILTIYASSGADNGFVSCIAENEAGQEIAEASLEIHGKYRRPLMYYFHHK
ncbi:ig-like domain-containing protein [Caerostris extrusa]|uniref:Ig-like domain-containing protein n=1 Tax=Caerostris extrusa TaxID=172846 RepID=A0AAV4SBJ8_CAEEX|nr:ig-like domain-containing protein [Caerostris extrusa]